VIFGFFIALAGTEMKSLRLGGESIWDSNACVNGPDLSKDRDLPHILSGGAFGRLPISLADRLGLRPAKWS
jgi:hypothetical protein